MTDGLITRIGHWIDHRWEAKATESMVLERCNSLENAQIRDRVDLEERIGKANLLILDQVEKLSERIEAVGRSKEDEKDVHDLKTRLEKIELYSGMTRKVDPTKPPMVKSAFQI